MTSMTTTVTAHLAPLASQFVLWAIVTIALILTAGAITRRSDHDRRSRQAGAVQPLPGAVPTCTQRLCTGQALFTVHDGIHARRVCYSCAEAGFRRQWWVTFYRHGEPFDQAAAEVVAEAERIAKEARA